MSARTHATDALQEENLMLKEQIEVMKEKIWCTSGGELNYLKKFIVFQQESHAKNLEIYGSVT